MNTSDGSGVTIIIISYTDESCSLEDLGVYVDKECEEPQLEPDWNTCLNPWAADQMLRAHDRRRTDEIGTSTPPRRRRRGRRSGRPP